MVLRFDVSEDLVSFVVVVVAFKNDLKQIISLFASDLYSFIVPPKMISATLVYRLA